MTEKPKISNPFARFGLQSKSDAPDVPKRPHSTTPLKSREAISKPKERIRRLSSGSPVRSVSPPPTTSRERRKTTEASSERQTTEIPSERKKKKKDTPEKEKKKTSDSPELDRRISSTSVASTQSTPSRSSKKSTSGTAATKKPSAMEQMKKSFTGFSSKLRMSKAKPSTIQPPEEDDFEVPETKRKKNVCGMCETGEEHEALYRCIECNKLLCDNANKLHLENSSTAKHQIISLFSDKTESDFELPIFCGTHYREYEQFCIKDSELICAQCAKKDHRKHPTKSIEEAYKEKAKEIGKLSQKANKNVQQIQNRIETLRLTERKIDEASEQVKAQMDAYFQELENLLRLRHQSLLSELSHISTEKKLLLQSQSQNFLNDVKKIQNVTTEINHTLSQESQLHILHLEKQLVSKLTNINSQFSNLSSTLEDKSITPECNFVSDSETTQQLATSIQSLGTLRYEPPPTSRSRTESDRSEEQSISGTEKSEQRTEKSEHRTELSEKKDNETEIVGLPDFLGSNIGGSEKVPTERKETSEKLPLGDHEESEERNEKSGKPERTPSESSINGVREKRKKKKKQREMLDD